MDTTPCAGQTRAANLTGFSSYARRKGADPRRILERHGIETRALTDPDTHVNCQSLVDVFEYCSTIFEDPLFGLHFAAGQAPEVFGCITALCRSAPDLRTAISCLIDYVPIVHSPEAALELVESAETAELRWGVNSNLGVNDQANQQALMLIVKLLRSVGGPDFALSHVEIAVDARPSDVAEIEDIVGCRIRNRAPNNAIGFPKHALEMPIPSANRLLYRLLGGYLDRVKQANRITLTDRVRNYIRGALPTGTCSIERCADKLGMSVRTLQDRLAHDGGSFTQVMEQQRMTLAEIYLRRENATLDEVAEWLGYGEQTSFGRAFKRWTGTTPRKFRQT
ncbi:AraC family transcriptional regulator ligand-binding domain-containing protein [Sphingomonas oligophenolica]|uniref:AraC family transcriptional regulator ligand-binding domain-containing protein n=1 Tax=Sphingomonas oligophenolica TaxID=301154 RepID=A0ABU9Y8W5_9SPHN